MANRKTSPKKAETSSAARTLRYGGRASAKALTPEERTAKA